jgi:hypothetical protein
VLVLVVVDAPRAGVVVVVVDALVWASAADAGAPATRTEQTVNAAPATAHPLERTKRGPLFASRATRSIDRPYLTPSPEQS